MTSPKPMVSSAGYEGGYVTAGKGYDSGQFRQSIADRGMTPVIPPRSGRKEPHEYDAHLYRERRLVECFINKMKQLSPGLLPALRNWTPDTWPSSASPALSSGSGKMSTRPSYIVASLLILREYPGFG